ncbi:uncharacterized protein LOC124283380 isoform X2 [Haliotis rubra]|uniref:uncharacterized protein LOC124283380 isoform X2 n=1 Tax=Haliotis rubra TaxID=36100 RepID=UPI001EE63033|nr:uncharacterized protein LOC124283380 isoform X2 [Haliotis rubra]
MTISPEISKSARQAMAKLEGKVNPEAENEFHLKTKDFLRPSLKQIGNSIAEIKRYFQEPGVIRIVPSRPNNDLQDINDDLMSRITGDGFLFKENIVKGASSELCENTPGLVLLTNSFGPTFNLPTLPQTVQQLCDIFLALPQQPPMLLTVIDAFPETKNAKDYNAHLAREMTTKLRLFTSESVNFVRGIISRNDLKDARLFQARLRVHASLSSIFPPKSSFSMNQMKYDQVMTAFWAVVAETKSVVTEKGDVNRMDIQFLTKEQCVVLVENMNSKHVQVRCKPGSGATTLMLEVTRRLSRLGETLLVCRSREETDRLRPLYPSIISLHEVGNRDLCKFENVVHDTHAVLHGTNGRHWQFLRETSTADLRKRVTAVEMVVIAMDNQLEAMKCENWKQRMKYMQSEMDVLKLFHQLAGSHALNTISHKTDILPRKCLSDDISLSSRESGGVEPHMGKLMERIEDRKDPFPTLATFIMERKAELMYLRAKMTFLEKATKGSEDKDPRNEQGTLQEGKHNRNEQCLNPGKAEMREKHRQKKKLKRKYSGKLRHRRSSKEDNEDSVVRYISKQHPSAIPETQAQPPNPKSEETQWTFEGTGKLQDRLETFEKARDENIRQLIPLLTVEWQNTLNYLKRHTATLSWFGEDTRGFHYDQRERHDPFVHETHSRQEGICEDQRGDQTDTKSQKSGDVGTDEVASVAKDVDSTRALSISHPIGKSRCKQESPVYQLRNFQLGRLNVMCIYGMLGQIAVADNENIGDLQDKCGHMEKAFGCPLHVVGELDSSRCHPVSCPTLLLDAKRANQRRCHVTADGKLVNSPPATKAKDDTGLEEYSGTCSHVPILLPEHLTGDSGSLPVQYWETHTDVGVVGGQGWPPILEMGLSEAGLVDSRTWICNQPRSWCVTVWRCKKHGGKICTRAYKEGDWGDCMIDTMSDIPGTKATLCYGVVLDVVRGRVAFIDLNRKVVLARYDVQFKETLFPMFGVWRRSEDFSVEMTLINGVDITMTDTKRALLCQSLK